jgi:CRISPR system Cascade subunit CasD
MREHLVFQLQAPLSSWGETAVGDFRPSNEQPTQSALVGMLGAALGVQRSDEAGHAALRDGYAFAVASLDSGRLLRDYHTAQVPPRSALKGHPRATRAQELALPARELSTTVSTRDYRQGAHHLVAVQSLDAQPRWALEALAQALRTPVYTLSLGRKTCVPGAPLWPQLVPADSALAALAEYRRRLSAALGQPLPELASLAFDNRVCEPGTAPTFTRRRKDRLIRRQGWQFGDRDEHLALLDAQALKDH